MEYSNCIYDNEWQLIIKTWSYWATNENEDLINLFEST